MGHTIWVQAKNRESETNHDLSIIHRLGEELAALSSRLGVKALTSFYDNSDLAAAMSDEFGQIPAEALKPVWFEAAEGLQTVAALLRQLTADFGSLGWEPSRSRRHWPEAVLKELQFCETVLTRAVAESQPFRLLIVA